MEPWPPALKLELERERTKEEKEREVLHLFRCYTHTHSKSLMMKIRNRNNDQASRALSQPMRGLASTEDRLCAAADTKGTLEMCSHKPRTMWYTY